MLVCIYGKKFDMKFIFELLLDLCVRVFFLSLSSTIFAQYGGDCGVDGMMVGATVGDEDDVEM